ncbi:MAG: response regulator [Chloroflexi bacterium]|nr:response regulator [Chloroflexota bacterium]
MPTRILIVDDSRTEALRTRLILEREGYQVSLAVDGREGLVKAAEERPDLILLDTLMPNMNGFEACGRLKLDPKTSTIPVVLLPVAEEIADMPSGPAQDCFLPKPYDPSQLVTRAKDMTNGHGRAQTAAATPEEVRRYQEELERARQQVEVPNRARRDILANISHELRTPLHEIIGMTDLLQGTELNGEQKIYVDTTRVSSNALLSLIGDVIEFSELQSGQLLLDVQPFGVSEPIERTVEVMAARAADKGLRLSTLLSPAIPPKLVGDANRLRQVLNNLVANAIRFTDSGEISIGVDVESTRERQVELHFRVQDTGIGIADDRREVIFEPFQQADTSATRRYGGMGMGLAMARQLVNLMGGRIWVESQLGKGSAFHFVVLLGLPEGAVAVAPAAAADWPRSLQILVAEDSPTNQLIAKASLKKAGHTVTLAVNGCDAVQAYVKSRQPNEPQFDVILMDVAMPEMDGLDATRAIREQEKSRGGHIVVVAMTAFATKEYHEKCLEAGMDAYVTKPVRIEELDKTLGPLMTRAAEPPAAPAAQPPAEPPVSLKDALQVVGDDVDILRDAAAISLEEVPQQMQALEQAMAAQDPKAVEAKAHRIKGVMGNLGGMAARAVAQKLETMGEQANLAGGPSLVQSLKCEVGRVAAFYGDSSWEERAREMLGGNDG